MLPTTLSNYALSTPDQVHYDDVPAPRTILQRIGSALRWVAELPRRRAMLDELNGLSDHELADIGLSRGELSRVFDTTLDAERNETRIRAVSTKGRFYAA